MFFSKIAASSVLSSFQENGRENYEIALICTQITYTKIHFRTHCSAKQLQILIFTTKQQTTKLYSCRSIHSGIYAFLTGMLTAAKRTAMVIEIDTEPYARIFNAIDTRTRPASGVFMGVAQCQASLPFACCLLRLTDFTTVFLLAFFLFVASVCVFMRVLLCMWNIAISIEFCCTALQ